MMRSGSAVQTKGLGLRLCPQRYRLTAAWRSTNEWKAPRCRRRRASEAKKVSTAFAQEQEVGANSTTRVDRPEMIAGHVSNCAGAKEAYVIKHPAVQEHLTEPEAIGGGGDHVAMVEADRVSIGCEL